MGCRIKKRGKCLGEKKKTEKAKQNIKIEEMTEKNAAERNKKGLQKAGGR